MDEVRMEFHGLSEEQLKHLFRAERQLSKAGVLFDTGYDFEGKRRDWELDWSLRGASIVVKKQ